MEEKATGILKNWKQYLAEFFMLFAAVTLGFFAENYREGIVEQHKKDKLLHSVVDNFKLDKKKFIKIIKNYDYVVDGTDNFETKFLINDISLKYKK